MLRWLKKNNTFTHYKESTANYQHFLNGIHFFWNWTIQLNTVTNVFGRFRQIKLQCFDHRHLNSYQSGANKPNIFGFLVTD